MSRLVDDRNGTGFAVYPDDLTLFLILAIAKTYGVSHLPMSPGVRRVWQLEGGARKFEAGQPRLLTQILSGSMGSTAVMQFIQCRIEMPIMHRSVMPLPGAVLQQVGKFMAAGMSQQVQHTYFPSKIA